MAKTSKGIERVRRFIRYSASGALSFVIIVGLTALLHELLGFAEELAYASALVTAFVTNFLVMRYFVYAAREGHPGRQLAMYALSALGFRGLEYLGFLTMHSGLGIHYLATAVTVQVVSFLAKFPYYGSVVFAARRTGEPEPAGSTSAVRGRDVRRDRCQTR